MSVDGRDGERLRGPSPEEEQEGAQQLLGTLSRIGDLVARYEARGARPASARSEMGVDDRLTTPLQISHLAGYSMSVAVDNLKACRALLENQDGLRIYQVAQYPLLRSAIESAAHVIWLLGPAERRDRVRRMLQARTSEMLFDRRLVKRVSLDRPGDDSAMRSTRNAQRRRFDKNRKETERFMAVIAGHFGIDRTEYEGGQPVWQDIVEDASMHAFSSRGDLGATLWMMASGLTHPSSERFLMLSVVEQFAQPIDDVHTARLSGSTRTIDAVATGAHVFLRGADLLIRLRRLQIDDASSGPAVAASR